MGRFEFGSRDKSNGSVVAEEGYGGKGSGTPLVRVDLALVHLFKVNGTRLCVLNVYAIVQDCFHLSCRLITSV